MKNVSQKEFGAFYSSEMLASFIAEKICSLMAPLKIKKINCIDPAVGDGVLLVALEKYTRTIPKRSFVGLDIRDEAVFSAEKIFSSIENCQYEFFKKDGLYPEKSKSSSTGWNSFKRKNAFDRIDVFVSNPPWGTSLSKYSSLKKDFSLANGQFDVYDLFVELILKNVSENGFFGVILPDSIYGHEHFRTRKMFLESSKIYYIIRLGEGFFQDVNTSASIVIGKKVTRRIDEHLVFCSHLDFENRKKVLGNKLSLNDAVQKSGHFVSQRKMIESDFQFLTDVYEEDDSLIERLEKLCRIGMFSNSYRGVELSKKGEVFECPECGIWNPVPRGKEKTFCPHCNSSVALGKCKCDKIIVENSQPGLKKIIVGENIERYFPKKNLFLRKGVLGINYKSNDIYSESKILVRKTGVGVTACIDYCGCFTNQVVYILKIRNEWKKKLPLEFLLAVLNSRIATYYLLKKYGNSEWKTHPYLTQFMLSQIPFPSIEGKQNEKKIKQVVKLVKSFSDKRNVPSKDDAKVERLLLDMFCLTEMDYDRIFLSIKTAQPLIPYKRLLNVKKGDLF